MIRNSKPANITSGLGESQCRKRLLALYLYLGYRAWACHATAPERNPETLSGSSLRHLE